MVDDGGSSLHVHLEENIAVELPAVARIACDSSADRSNVDAALCDAVGSSSIFLQAFGLRFDQFRRAGCTVKLIGNAVPEFTVAKPRF